MTNPEIQTMAKAALLESSRQANPAQYDTLDLIKNYSLKRGFLMAPETKDAAKDCVRGLLKYREPESSLRIAKKMYLKESECKQLANEEVLFLLRNGQLQSAEDFMKVFSLEQAKENNPTAFQEIVNATNIGIPEAISISGGNAEAVIHEFSSSLGLTFNEQEKNDLISKGVEQSILNARLITAWHLLVNNSGAALDANFLVSEEALVGVKEGIMDILFFFYNYGDRESTGALKNIIRIFPFKKNF